MRLVIKRGLIQIAIAVAFVLACIAGFYVIYWADIADVPPQKVQQVEVSDDSSFTEEVQRFLTTYFSQDFPDELERLDFVRIEALRLSKYPLKEENELVLRNKLLSILEQIIIKGRAIDFDYNSENQSLQALLKELQ
ncbi:MAG: hypothetical protein ACD_19C00407G0001 [uncultured bacterium]|nr:MAG: hypothetical protein ACD_19C00407G0001 [uncultured bacterium]